MRNRTPFFDKHVQLGGKIVDFFGWELPVQYSTITLEHTAVREKAGLFDISHMGQVFVWGPEAADYLQHLVTNDIRKATVGKGIYAHLLNEQGGVIDDIFIYRLEEEKFLVIVNASRREPDLAWMLKQKDKFEVEIIEVPYAAAFALQGPKAVSIVEKLNPSIPQLPRFGIDEFEIGDVSAHVARTGYTGEDGFEFFAPAGHLLIIWDMVMGQRGQVLPQQDLTPLPCGLGARDTLRTEVSYPLYGHELDEKHTPFEAGLDWVVKLEKGNFIGRAALVKQKEKGLPSKLLGFKVEEGGVARSGGIILINDQEVGTVASGTFAPSLGFPIGMAFFPPNTAQEGAKFTIRQGTRELKAVTTKMPFFKKPVVAAHK